MASKRKSTRRQFLRGTAAIDALGELAQGEAPALPEQAGDPTTRSYLMQVGRRAMACEFQVYLNAGQHSSDVESAMQALNLVEQLEDQLSVYREHSEISAINRPADAHPLAVERRFFALLQRSRQLSADTSGAFDITAAPLTKLWGFFRQEGRVPASSDLAAALQRVGSQFMELDEEKQTIRFARPGMEINLGGIGKGYALDRCRELLDEADIGDFLIHGGNSSVLAKGSRSRAGSSPGWTVAVRHPLRTDQRLLEIQVHDRAIGTSGAAKQYFYHQGRRFGHVLDPRTGYPAEGVLAATVVAADAATADALSTAFYVMGREKVEDYCRRHSGVAAILVCPGSRAGAIEVIPLAMDGIEWRMAD